VTYYDPFLTNRNENAGKEVSSNLSKSTYEEIIIQIKNEISFVYTYLTLV